MPVYMNFRFFNVENPQEIKKGIKPKVREIGPYVYRETRRKENILELDGEHLQYATYMAYEFDQEKTNSEGCEYNGGHCTKDDNITIINPMLLAIGEILYPIPDGTLK